MCGFPSMENGAQTRRVGQAPSYSVNTDPAMHNHHSASGAGHSHHIQDESLNNLVGQFSNLGLGVPNTTVGSGTAIHGLNTSGAFMTGADGSIVFAAPYTGPIHPLLAEHAFAGPYPIQYPAGSFAAYAPGSMVPLTPGRPIAFGERVPRDLPTLENRRSSYSTSATESTPATPFFGNAIDRMNGGTRVASLERSSFTTPSPREQATYMAGNGPVKHALDLEIERLIMLDPPIPKAVPAVWTDHIKPLEQCLENRIHGNRNVYIRGLHPTTDDDLLLRYAERFGEVEQSKAIIDTTTGACKGFGFSKFKDIRDSEKCIRGFYRLGYEVGFARESFNARLKAEGDENSTNLYISNLPKDINEAMLNHIFDPVHVVSSKILRDSMGNSRGVGFARFETRKICERVIQIYNGVHIGKEHYIMQVRYADTPSQKELKRITAERRQYRTNEYNIGAYGTHAVGMNPSIYTQPTWNRRPAANSFSHGTRPGPWSTATRSSRSAGPSGSAESQPQEDPHAAESASSDEESVDEGATVIEPPTTEDGISEEKPSDDNEA